MGRGYACICNAAALTRVACDFSNTCPRHTNAHMHVHQPASATGVFNFGTAAAGSAPVAGGFSFGTFCCKVKHEPLQHEPLDSSLNNSTDPNQRWALGIRRFRRGGWCLFVRRQQTCSGSGGWCSAYCRRCTSNGQWLFVRQACGDAGGDRWLFVWQACCGARRDCGGTIGWRLRRWKR